MNYALVQNQNLISNIQGSFFRFAGTKNLECAYIYTVYICVGAVRATAINNQIRRSKSTIQSSQTNPSFNSFPNVQHIYILL